MDTINDTLNDILKKLETERVYIECGTDGAFSRYEEGVLNGLARAVRIVKEIRDND